MMMELGAVSVDVSGQVFILTKLQRHCLYAAERDEQPSDKYSTYEVCGAFNVLQAQFLVDDTLHLTALGTQVCAQYRLRRSLER